MKWHILIITFSLLIPIVKGAGTLELPARMEYKTSETMTLYAQVLDENNNPVDNATCSVTIYYPDRTVWVSNENFVHLSDDLYYYNKTLPSIVGVYPFEVNCTYPVLYGAEIFHVAGWTTDITDIENEVGLLDDIEDNTDKIPGIRNGINFISINLQNLGMSQRESFLYAFILLTLILIIVVIAIIVFLWNSLRVKIFEAKETEEEAIENESWI